jgi:hypothetical protein
LAGGPHILLVFTAFGILFGVLLLIGDFAFHWYTRDDFVAILNDAWLVFMFLSIGIGGNLMIPTYQRRVALFRAAQERQFDVIPQATPQPAPDSTVLSIPATIELVGRRRVALGWATAIYIVIALVFLLAQVVASSIAPNGIFLWMLGLMSVLYIFIAGVLVAQPLHQTIRITEAGLTVRSNESHTMRWDAVCVFALVDGFRWLGASKVYIVRSGMNRVRWIHRSRTRWYSITAPTTSDEEYQRQMQALLSYAAARTRLPLLDLR